MSVFFFRVQLDATWQSLQTPKSFKINGAGLADTAVFLQFATLYLHSDFLPQFNRRQRKVKGYLPAKKCYTIKDN